MMIILKPHERSIIEDLLNESFRYSISNTRDNIEQYHHKDMFLNAPFYQSIR